MTYCNLLNETTTSSQMWSRPSTRTTLLHRFCRSELKLAVGATNPRQACPDMGFAEDAKES